MHETRMQPRQECVDCGSHTYRDTCSTCGSMRLLPVTPGPEDIRRVGELPLSMRELRRFRREVAELPQGLARV